MTTKHATREAWLQAAVTIFRPWFSELGHEVPEKIHVSIGFPRNDRKGKVIGQCWVSEASTDLGSHIFIHPKLDDLTQILDVLLHELSHAADDCQSKHTGNFVKIVRALGLEGKPTATFAGDELRTRLADVLKELGEFPHASLLGVEPDGGAKKQTTRMIKVECPKCSYTLRTTKKWLAVGLPTCVCGTPMESDQPTEDEPEDED